MWCNGLQKVTREYDFNEELLRIDGELDEIEAKITLAKFLKYNLGFTVSLISNMELLPLQEIAIRGVLKRDNSLIVAGRGGSKSTLISVLAFLYPIFNLNSKTCILSTNFRSARRILESTEKILNNKKSKILAQCFKKLSRSNDYVRRGPDMYLLELVQPANAEVFALPLTEGLRGTRASFVMLDEALMVSKDIQEHIIRPFLTARQNMQEEMLIRSREDELIKLGVITENDRISFTKNKYCAFSSASYQFEYLYEMFQNTINSINTPPSKDEEDKPTQFCMRFSYEAIPDNTFIDLTQIKVAAANGGEHTDYFKREYKALFTDSNDSYFNIRKLHHCTIPNGQFPTTQIIGDKNSEYILAIDPSYSASKSSDYFAMALYLLNKDERKITLVHTYGRSGGELKDHFERLTYFLLYFNVVMIIIDASGTEFISGYNESTIAKEKNLSIGMFKDIDFNTDDINEYNQSLKKLKNSYNYTSKRIAFAQGFSTANNSITRMNQHLQNQINAEKVWFGSCATANEVALKRFSSISLPFDFKNNKEQILSLYDFIEDQDSWIKETKAQLALIEVKATSSGVLQYGFPTAINSIKGDNRPRKDHYTCLLLANWMAKIYFDMVMMPVEVENKDMFVPVFI